MKKQFKWLWYNMRGKHALYILAMVCTVAANIMQLIVPVFSQNIVDVFISGDNAAYNIVHNKSLFYALIIGMVCATFLRTAIVYGGNMLYEHVSQHMIYNLRTTLFRNVEKQGMEFYHKYRTGDLMTRLTGDLDAIRHMAAWVIRMMIECVVLFGVSAVYYFYLDPLMAICLISLCPVIFVLMMLFRKNVAPLHDELRQKLAVMNTAAQENIAGNRVVKAFAREDYEINKFEETNRDYSEVNKKTSFMWLKYYPFVEGCANGLSIIMLLAGGLFLITGRISSGEYVAFSGLTWTLSNPMRNIGSVLNEFQRFVSASDKVMEIYYAEPSMKEDENPVEHPERLKGKIQFEHVDFAYEDEKEVTVLKNINFTINPGETVAIMGDTGSGKTSLINLIPRFYDPDNGVVKIDDIDVKKYRFSQLRKNIGMATQDVLLYSDTIDGNIAYGNSKMSEKTVRDFAGVAAVTDFVAKMEGGFDTIVGERGVGLSGGQKQRISLARALAVKPAILILDDTTSAVDMETEKIIQDNLKNLDFMCTKVIIAQRISSTKDADKIIIIRDGRITEMGTHDELLANKGYYYDVYALQNGLYAGGV